MNEMQNYILQYSPTDADKLLACADGTCALLYLHILRHGSFSLSSASKELKRTESEIALAADSLRKLGILHSDYALQSEELPDYNAKEIAGKAQTDSNFEGIVVEAQRQLGKILSTNDLRILLGIYDHIGLPAEVIVLLIGHCVETYASKNGEGRAPTMRYIEKEAWYWAKSEVLTFDAAEEHISCEKEKTDHISSILDVLQIKNRSATQSEQKFIETWLSLGFEGPALSIAYDRTVIATGRLVWKYMDKILASWHEKDLHTPKEIEEGDRKTPKPPTSSDDEDMRQMFERMKKGG